jgi:hypothetical protein
MHSELLSMMTGRRSFGNLPHFHHLRKTPDGITTADGKGGFGGTRETNAQALPEQDPPRRRLLYRLTYAAKGGLLSLRRGCLRGELCLSEIAEDRGFPIGSRAG